MYKLSLKNIEKYGDSYSLNTQLSEPKITIIKQVHKLKSKKKSISLKYGKCIANMQQIS